MKPITKITTKNGFMLLDLEGILSIEYNTHKEIASIYMYSSTEPIPIKVECSPNEILDIYVQWNKMKEKKNMLVEMFQS